MPPSRAIDQEWLATLKNKAGASDKSWLVAFCLSLFLGPFGADRFYLGHGIIGLLKLFTLGGFGVLWIGDVVLLLIGYTKDANGCGLKRW